MSEDGAHRPSQPGWQALLQRGADTMLRAQAGASVSPMVLVGWYLSQVSAQEESLPQEKSIVLGSWQMLGGVPSLMNCVHLPPSHFSCVYMGT